MVSGIWGNKFSILADFTPRPYSSFRIGHSSFRIDFKSGVSTPIPLNAQHITLNHVSDKNKHRKPPFLSLCRDHWVSVLRIRLQAAKKCPMLLSTCFALSKLRYRSALYDGKGVIRRSHITYILTLVIDGLGKEA